MKYSELIADNYAVDFYAQAAAPARFVFWMGELRSDLPPDSLDAHSTFMA